jgi:hypothetical protein
MIPQVICGVSNTNVQNNYTSGGLLNNLIAFRGSEVQEFRGSEVQEFRGSGVQRFRCPQCPNSPNSPISL